MGRWGLCCLSLICCLLLVACSPSLNWREVQLGSLRTLLPCKPDTGSRPVVLGGQTLKMDMIGCEAGGALLAISRVQATDAVQAAKLMAMLRQASLDQVGSVAVRPRPNSGDEKTSYDVQVDGSRSKGLPLQVRFKWLLADADVYQMAVYAQRLSPELTDNLTNEARIYQAGVR
jgi:hypothetical protein